MLWWISGWSRCFRICSIETNAGTFSDIRIATVKPAQATASGSMLVSSVSSAFSIKLSLNASNCSHCFGFGLYRRLHSGLIKSIIGLYPSNTYRSLKSVGLLDTSLKIG